jgi:hypothetical protein
MKTYKSFGEMLRALRSGKVQDFCCRSIQKTKHGTMTIIYHDKRYCKCGAKK